MVSVRSLWIPTLISAVLVFLASSLSHSVLRFHRQDFRKVPNEGDVMDVLGKAGVSPGDYLFPRPSGAEEMRSPAFQEKWKTGPVGFMTILPGGGRAPGATFGLWFLYCIVVEIFAAFLVGRSLSPGASASAVFLLFLVAVFGGHVLALWQGSIWYGRDVATMFRFTVDGLAYGLLSAGTFSLLWPK